jgi:hypothetical protein
MGRGPSLARVCTGGCHDALDPDQIASGLAHAENATLKRVREYEPKFRRRDVVLRALVKARHHGQPAPS